MAGLDLSSILESAGNYNQAVAAGTVGLQKNANAQEQLSGSNADLYKTIGESAALIDTTKQQAELAVQQAKIKGANALGTNMKDQSEVISQLAGVIQTEYQNKDQALQQIQAKQSVGFFDDPLQYIINQFTINDDIAKHNAANERLQSAEKQMATLNQLTQSNNLTQTQLAEPITAASIKATSDSLLAQAQQKSNDERIKGLVYNSDGIKAALNADKERMQTAFSVFGAQKQEQQIDIALQHLELSRAEFDWRKQEKEKGQLTDDYLIDKINQGGQARLGEAYIPIPKGSIKAAQVISLLKSNSPAGKQFQEDYLIGDQSTIAGTKILAPSPARAIDMINSMPVNLSAAQGPVKNLLNSTLGDTQKLIQAGQLDPKNKDAVQAFMNKRAQDYVDSQAKLVKPGDSDNVFQIPNLKTLIANSPTVAKLPVVQNVIGPAIAAGADLNDPNQVFALVAKGLESKTISYPQALELTTIYHVGQNTNLEARQLTSLGLVPRFSYNAKITTNPLSNFGGDEVVDLTKSDQVGRALNKYLASSTNPFAQNGFR